MHKEVELALVYVLQDYLQAKMDRAEPDAKLQKALDRLARIQKVLETDDTKALIRMFD